jgi:hypothetical protein
MYGLTCGVLVVEKKGNHHILHSRLESLGHIRSVAHGCQSFPHKFWVLETTLLNMFEALSTPMAFAERWHA